MNQEANSNFEKASNTGLRHLINAARFSRNGLIAAFKLESAFRQELAMLLFAIPAAIWIADSLLDFVLLMAVCLLVLVVELLNSAVEATIDRIGKEHHPISALAKDYGSAAVMLSLIIAGAVWLAMLITRLEIL
ncbi:MAG: diacylglycerol kinase [Gammaproteobacteria bacterium]|jgi:diacylglycerol kinase (ATP)|nr:diacylglycerol kinase [Gammaproteobacteria bacterium]|tara:strand:+ start:88 stop:489 length:402 start_codon:yes stop_codon:yes gene_type:complete